MVGTIGFEPTTSSVSRKRSNQLSYAPARRLELELVELITIQTTGGTKPNNQLLGSLSGSLSDANASPAAVVVPSLTNDEIDRSLHLPRLAEAPIRHPEFSCEFLGRR